MSSLDQMQPQADVSTFAGKDSQEAHTMLDHMCSLNPRRPAVHTRKTSIICTIGPASNKPEVLREMIKNGMNIARLNFSHGSHEYHADTIRLIREVGAEFPEMHVGIALDTKGPEIRTGLLVGGASAEVKLIDGQEIILTTDELAKEACTAQMVYIDYKNINKVVHIGSKVYIDDGLLCLKVLERLEKGIRCVVENGGFLGSRKGVNLPGCKTDLPAVTDKDREDLKFAVDHGVDIIFLSFIRDAMSLKEIKIDMGQRGRKIKLIAKIENEEGVSNIDEIIQEADGIMVARGDLGIEIPTQKVTLVQKQIIAKCNFAGKPVICATQMLESMVKNPRATRAECSDIANAVLDGADCVMLSGETAKGAHPLESLATMHRICREAEAAFHTQKFLEAVLRGKLNRGKVETLALAATTSVLCSHAAAIIVISITGMTAHMVAKFRPPVPIVTVCKDPVLAHQMHLWRGILPLVHEQADSNDTEGVEECLQYGIEEGIRRGFINKGDSVVLINSWPGAKDYAAMMRIKFVE